MSLDKNNAFLKNKYIFFKIFTKLVFHFLKPHLLNIILKINLKTIVDKYSFKVNFQNHNL